MIHKLSFDELQAKPHNLTGGLEIIKFYSNGCPMCHHLKDLYVTISQKYLDVKFYVFNVDIFDGDPNIFPMIDGVPTLCKIDPIKGFVRFPDPTPPDANTWYTSELIEQFIQKEQQK